VLPRPSASAATARRKDARTARARYYRAVAEALASYLADDRTPVVLAGPPLLQAEYRAVGSGPEPLEGGIDTGPRQPSRRALHARALHVVEEDAALVRAEVLAQVASAAGSATFDLAEIARAAAGGRVRAFVHAPDVRVWGRFDPATGEIVIHDRQRDATDADPLDDIAEAVLLSGGHVFAVPADAIPGRHAAAALYRAMGDDVPQLVARRHGRSGKPALGSTGGDLGG
jgi:hypothetical protein